MTDMKKKKKPANKNLIAKSLSDPKFRRRSIDKTRKTTEERERRKSFEKLKADPTGD